MASQENQRSSVVPWLLFLLTATALGAVLYFGWGLWSAERERGDLQTRTAAEAEVKLAELTATRRALEERVRLLEGDKEALSANMTAISADLKDAEAELARLRATYQSLEQKMDAEIRKGEIRLTQGEGRIKVDLVDKVLFDSGQAELSARGAEVLARLSTVLAGIDDKLIQVAGHTDDAPIINELTQRYPTNWELSAARAVNVVRFLSEKGGVAPKRLAAAGHGPFQPIASNSTPTGRAQNRRIEILLLPSFAKKPTAPATAAATKPVAPRAVKKAAATKPATTKRTTTQKKTARR